MKHFNISGEPKDQLARIMISQESNSFGDQYLTLKRLVTKHNADIGQTITFYDDVAYTSRQEGDWMSQTEMLAWAEAALRK